MEHAPIPHDSQISVGDFALQALIDAMIARNDKAAFETGNKIIELHNQEDEA